MIDKSYSMENIKKLVLNSNSKDWEQYIEDNKIFYIYKHDVRLQIRDLESDGNSLKKFEEKWAITFPDTNAYRNLYAIYFDNNKVFKWMQVVVDGGRASMPLPKSCDDLTVTKEQYTLALLIESLGSISPKLDEYIERKKFIIK
jgi:hypothetical protein